MKYCAASVPALPVTAMKGSAWDIFLTSFSISTSFVYSGKKLWSNSEIQQFVESDLVKYSEKVVQTNLICGTPNQR